MTSFAIVIPNLNQSHYLHTALESLKHQSTPYNLALMDGGSTDSFNDVVKRYSDIISFIRSAPDDGQSSSIREGFNCIDGDILCWLNADDYYFPGVLDEVAAIFHRNPDIDVVYGDAVHVNDRGFFLNYFPFSQEFSANDITKSCFICQPACFFRRKAYERVEGINPFLVYTMDWDLWCRLSGIGARFYYLNKVLAAVRYYPGTKTLSGDPSRYKEIWRIEKIFGKRLLPIAVFGFYYYDLSLKRDRTKRENVAFFCLHSLRKIKKLLISKNLFQSKLKTNVYGFDPLRSIITGSCEIQLPWYEERKWKELVFTVKPSDAKYDIFIGDHFFKGIVACGGKITVPVSFAEGPYRRIVMSCTSRRKWELLNLSFTLF